MTPDDLNVPNKIIPIKKIQNLRSNAEEGVDNIYADEDEEDEDDDLSEDRIRLDDSKKEEMLKKLCSFCDKPKCTVFCKNFCKRSFHE
jgi:hypothetical protein